MKHYDPPEKHHKAKTPEEEVEPLADPEPDDAWPPVKEPPDDDDDAPKKAARADETPPPGAVDPGFGVAGLSLEELQKLRDLRAVAQSSFEMSGPHHQ